MAQVAFSAYGSEHTSDGSPDVIEYERTIAETPECWDGTDFTAPEEGFYFFYIGFR